MPLKKKLNLLDVFCIATGTMISAGLFALPGVAYRQIGPSLFISYLLAGLFSIISVINQAELVSAMPKAGGAYFYVARSMGQRVGSIYGFVIWFSLAMKSAFALVGMAILIAPFVNLPVSIIAALLCFVLILINIIGIKEASIAQNIMVFILLAGLSLYISGGIFNVKLQNFRPFIPQSAFTLFSTAAFIFVAYGGLIEVSSIAEEVKNARKTLALGLILSIGAVVIFYTLAVFVTIGVLKAGVLKNSLTPVSDGAAVFMGAGGEIIMYIAALMAFITTANGGLMAASRYPLAGARDRVLPPFFSRLNKRFKTPHFSIIGTGAFMTLALFLNFESIVTLASTAAILTYMFSFLPVLIFRASRLKYYRPLFWSPFYPWLQIAGILGFGFLLFQLGWQTLWLSFMVIASVTLASLAYKPLRVKSEYALSYLVEKITGKKQTWGHLEAELKNILEEYKKNQ